MQRSGVSALFLRRRTTGVFIQLTGEVRNLTRQPGAYLAHVMGGPQSTLHKKRARISFPMRAHEVGRIRSSGGDDASRNLSDTCSHPALEFLVLDGIQKNLSNIPKRFFRFAALDLA